MRANWYHGKHEIPFLAIVRCDPTKRKCKTKEEIDKWISKNAFYFITQ
jgi:hypothetical protein